MPYLMVQVQTCNLRGCFSVMPSSVEKCSLIAVYATTNLCASNQKYQTMSSNVGGLPPTLSPKTDTKSILACKHNGHV